MELIGYVFTQGGVHETLKTVSRRRNDMNLLEYDEASRVIYFKMVSGL
jgi:hypothetical protein